MREGNDKIIPKLRVINANYSEPYPLELGVFNTIAKIDKEVENIEKLIYFRKDFKDYKSQILYELDEGLTQDRLSQIERFIEYFLEDKKNEKKNYKKDYFIYNFSFDKGVVQEFLKLNYLSEEERKNKFKKIFLDKFEDFIVNKGFRNFPNTKDWYLIFYKKESQDDFDFKFEYTPWFYDEWEVNKIGKVIEEKKVTLMGLMEKKTAEEIYKEIEYNNDVRDLFFSFINLIVYNKALFSEDFVIWNLREDFSIIREFIKENNIFFGEVVEDSVTFSLFISLIDLIINNKLLTIKDIEDKMTKELEYSGIFYVEFNDFFYQDLKIEIGNLFKWLNSLVKIKKTS